MPPSSGEKRKSTFDLKNQLSDLQNKLLDTQQGKQARNRHSTSQLSEIDPSDLNASTPRLPNVFGKRNKDGANDKRSSLPPMPLSAPAGQQGRGGSDVNFVVGLSENLLLECRRLTAESSQYKLQLKEAQDDLQRVTKQLTNVSVINKKFMEEEESMKDKTWELEGTLQQLKEKYEKLHTENIKVSQLKTESEKLADHLKNELELQKLAKLNLTEELAYTKQQWSIESKNFKSLNEDLNDENDKLHKSVSDLKEEVEQLKVASKKLAAAISPLTDSAFFNRNDSDSDNEFSVIDDPSASPFKNGPSRNIELEKETIQSKLVHSNKTIAKLRTTILKLRSEKEELEKKVTVANSSSKVSATYSSPANKGKKLKNLRSPPSLLSNRASKALSFYDNSDMTANENWEDYTFDNSPERLMLPLKDSSSTDDDDDEHSVGLKPDNRKLLSQELQSDPIDIVNKYVAENNLVFVARDEYNQLKDISAKHISYELQNSAIITAAEKYNILALPNSDGSHKLHIPVLLLKQKCEEQNLVLIDKDDYEDLIETTRYEPTEAELIERISRYNKVVLPLDEHEKMIKITSDPSLEFLQTKLEQNFDQVLIAREQYESLRVPSLTRIKDLAAQNNLVTLPVEEHKTLKDITTTPSLEFLQIKLKENYHQIPVDEDDYNKLKTPSLDYVKDLASQYKQVVIPLDQYEQLADISTTPSLSFLESKLKENHNHILISQNEYETLKTPSLDHIRKLASQDKHVVLPVEEHERLSRTVEEPSLEFLQSKLRKLHSSVLVGQQEHKDLLNPSLDRIKELASKNDHVILPVNEHQELTTNFTNPSLEFLESKLRENHNHVLVDEMTYASLDSPSIDRIKEKASQLQHVVLPSEEHDELKKIEASPSLEFLQSKLLKNYKQVLIPQEEYNHLKNPSLDDVKELASRNSLVLVPADEFTDLSKTVASPSLEFLQTKLLENHNHILLEQKDYDSLKNPSLEKIKGLASEAGHVMIPTDQHSLLIQKSTEPTVDELKSFADFHGHTTIPKEQYQKLQDQVTNPSSSQLYQYATAAGLVLLNKDDHSKLASISKSPSLLFLTSKLSGLNHVVIENEEYNSLKGLSQETAQEKAAKENAIVVPIEKFENLENERNELLEKLQSPDLEYLKQKASVHGHLLVDSNEHQTLLDSHNEPLSKKAELAGQVLVDSTEYRQTLDSLDHPTLEYITEKCQILGMDVVPQKELESLKEAKSLIESPTIQFLDSKASENAHKLISTDEYTLLKTLETKDGLTQLADKLELALIPVSELSELKALEHRLSNITASDVDDFASKLNLEAVDKSELQKLKQIVNKPTLENLKAHEKLLDVTVISKDEYDRLNLVAKQAAKDRDTLDKAEPETIAEMAAKAGLVVLPISAHEVLKKSANEPLEERAKRLDHVAIPSTEHKELLDQKSNLLTKLGEHENLIKEKTDLLTNPSIDYLELKASTHGLLLVKKTDLDDLISSKEETLDVKAKRENKVLLSLDEHQQLSKSLEEPSLEYLTEKALKLSHSILPLDELEILKQKISDPSQEQLEGHVKSRGSVILEKGQYDDYMTKATNPPITFLQEKAASHMHTVVPDDVYNDLLALQKESLSEKAEKVDSVVLPKSNYKRLSMLEDAPSVEFLKEKAQPLGYELVNIEFLRELRELNEEPLLAKANKEGKILLTGEEYSELQSKTEELEKAVELYKEKERNPEKDVLIKSATGLGLVVLTSEDFTNLSQAAASPSLDQLMGHATKKDHVLLAKWKYDILERKATSPNEDELKTFASNRGLSLIEPDELKRLNLEATRPSQAILNKAASELGLVLVAEKEYELLQQKFKARPTPLEVSDDSLPSPFSSVPSSPISPSKKSKVLSSKEHYEEIIRQENEKKQQRQKVAASKALGIVSLSTDEYKRLIAHQNVTEPTISDIYNGAKSFGLTVLPHSDYKALLKRQNSVETREDLDSAARSLGFSIVPLNSSNNGSVVSLVDDDDFQDAVSHQSSSVSLSSSELYEDALSRQHTETNFAHYSEPLSLDDLHDRAADFGFKLVLLDDPYESDDDTTSIEDNDAGDTIHGTSLIQEPSVSVADYEDLEKQLKEKSLKLSELENKTITKEELVELASEYGLVTISQQEYEKISKELTNEEIAQILSSRDMVMISKDQHELLLEQSEKSRAIPTISSVSAMATTLGLSVLPSLELDSLRQNQIEKLTNDHFHKIASDKDLIAIPKSDYENMGPAMSDTTLQDIASQRGFTILSVEEYSSLKSSAEKPPVGPTEEDIKKYLDNEGLVTLSKQQHEDLQALILKLSVKPTTDELRELATLLGLIVLSSEQYNNIQNHKVTELEIIDNAPHFGLAVIPQSQLIELQGNRSISVDDLQSKANENGMSVISTKELESLKNAEVSANALAVKAAQMDLVLVPQDTYESLKSSGVSGEGLEKAASKLGLLCIPESLYVPTTVAPTPDSHNVVILPKTYYNKLARSHTLSIERISKEDLIDHCRLRGILLASDQFNTADNENASIHVKSQHSPQSSYHSPVFNTYKTTNTTPTETTPKTNTNMVSSPSLFSLATNVSLTDRKMIPALTQTIIGEYLYKYYRRLGPFSSISENRHERYFWIHPYSLTLYWCATNPILGDPSTNKIRAAAILKVEVVEDNNPLPPGLYHKSIIVHSSERSIKITCPTRQRHNVWYNSLRYLIERTTEGLDLTQPFEHLQNSPPSTIEEEEEGDDNDDINTYRYIKPRSSMMRPLRVVSNPTRKNSRIFSSSGIHRSATSASLHRRA